MLSNGFLKKNQQETYLWTWDHLAAHDSIRADQKSYLLWMLLSSCASDFNSYGVHSLELWNKVENKRMTIPTYDNIISALAQSPISGMVASASHDCSVKFWK